MKAIGDKVESVVDQNETGCQSQSLIEATRDQVYSSPARTVYLLIKMQSQEEDYYRN
jgi:hypothetical protein